MEVHGRFFSSSSSRVPLLRSLRGLKCTRGANVVSRGLKARVDKTHITGARTQPEALLRKDHMQKWTAPLIYCHAPLFCAGECSIIESSRRELRISNLPNQKRRDSLRHVATHTFDSFQCLAGSF